MGTQNLLEETGGVTHGVATLIVIFHSAILDLRRVYMSKEEMLCLL